MELTELINHPERMDRETLYELRSIVALYPYFQTARLLLLQNLYLLHDTTFDEELRSAAIYITDRKVIFQLIEAVHYRLQKAEDEKAQPAISEESKQNRTISLIDSFLDSMPKEEQEPGHTKRKPTAADAAVDYVAYLLESESEEEHESETEVPKLRGQSLIDTFLEDNQGKIILREPHSSTDLTEIKEEEPPHQENNEPEENFFTEALARIYIKQGRYQKALDIITRLSEQHPHKNMYFDDQKRFLKKLIINNNKIN